MRILHSADLHLDAPLGGRPPEQTRFLRQKLLEIPGRLAALCRQKKCDLVLLAGDVFDGPCTGQSVKMLKQALEQMAVPVFISPGNHDYISDYSPWIREEWPENVHIFKKQKIESVALPQLDCRVYGAGYQAMDCPGLLGGFCREGRETYHLGVLHADPMQRSTPYCPMTGQQVENSGLDYLALGHVHTAGSFRAGRTLCAWPGCPMGRGYDETGAKGALIVELGDRAVTEFLPLGAPEFYDLSYQWGTGPVSRLLPPGGNCNFYRITLTGYAPPVDLDAMAAELERFPNLELRDRTVPEMELWKAAGEDTLEGLYFGLLRDQLGNCSPEEAGKIRLAAEISRRILDGQEVELP